MRPEDIIKTETGIRMYNAVTPGIYNQDLLQLSIFNANGVMMDEVYQRALKLHIEVLIQNATWSLPYWEQLFGINPKDSQTIEERRRAIIVRMNEYSPITRRRMESIIDVFTQNKGTKIDDKKGDYIFRVTLNNPGEIDFPAMIEAIEETKPAHLDYQITYKSEPSYMYVGTTEFSGEEVTIYPWTPEEITMETSVPMRGANQSFEQLTIYPRMSREVF